MRGRVHQSTQNTSVNEGRRASFKLIKLPKPAIDLLCLLAFLLVFCVIVVTVIMLLVWVM